MDDFSKTAQVEVEQIKEDSLLAGITLQHIIGSITIVTPALYVIGDFFARGHLKGYGVSMDYFPLSIQETLLQSFWLFAILVGRAFMYFKDHYIFIVPIALICILVFSKVAVMALNNPDAIQNIKNKIHDSDHFYSWIVPGLMTMLFSSYAAWIAGVVLLFVMLPLGAYLYSIELAEQFIESYEPCVVDKTNKSDCTFVYDGEELLYSGALIARSSEHIAIWDGNKAIITSIDGMKIHLTRSISDDEARK